MDLDLRRLTRKIFTNLNSTRRKYSESKVPNELKVVLFSQNSINRKFLNPNESTEIPNLSDSDPDIIVEMTQEDNRYKLTPLLELSLSNTPNKYKHNGISLNSLGGIDKNIIMQVFYKKSLQVYKIYRGIIPISAGHGAVKKLGSTFYSSKGGVYVIMEIPDYNPIVFLNMHLPINTKDKETFGYEYRKNSMLKILDKLNRVLLSKNMSNPIIIIGGDLNFRINPNDKKDQLTEFLRSDENKMSWDLSELDFPIKSDKIFTCKFDTTINDKGCRETEEPTEIDEGNAVDETVANIIKNVQNKCGDPNRFPSRCDRFLTNNPNLINVIVHKGKYFERFHSDHNAIYSLIHITKTPKRTPRSPTISNKSNNTPISLSQIYHQKSKDFSVTNPQKRSPAISMRTRTGGKTNKTRRTY